MNDPICPICGSDIELNDTIDSYGDDSSVSYICVGKCSNCDREYQWREVYTFSHNEDLKEIH